MGFTPEPEVLKLVFEKGTSLDGLEVKAKCCSIKEWQEMLSGSTSGPRPAGEVAKGNEDIAKKFLGYVTEWNLEFDNEPAPITYDSWLRLSTRQGAMIINAWQQGMVEVPTNSGDESSTGEISPEQLLAMASELDALPNWSPPTPS